MTDVFKTAIVTVANRQAADDACSEFEGGAGHFRREVLTEGVVTHYISTGHAPEEMWQAAQSAGAIVADDDPATILANLGAELGGWWTPPE